MQNTWFNIKVYRLGTARSITRPWIGLYHKLKANVYIFIIWCNYKSVKPVLRYIWLKICL